MTLEIVVVPCRTDNYAYLCHEPEGGRTTVVDAPEAAPILEAARSRGWRIDQILLTHHHLDHVEGVAEIRSATAARVVGASADSRRLPPLDLAVEDGSSVAIGNESGAVIDVSGHTVGHVAYLFPDARAAFTGDSLMALGCGRVFEGTFPMMHETLSRFLGLPEDMRIYSGHEYTEGNARFAITVDPGNADLERRTEEILALRAEGRPTVPSLLGTEFRTNPFLRCHVPGVKSALGMEGASDADVFEAIRRRKDRF